MAGKQAKVLSQTAVNHLLAWCLTTRQPIRNRALLLLSVKAGLRAAEIAT
jgi:integrase/recombinase XerD